MSSEYIANCECGFRKKFKVGGQMSTFKKFSECPFYCQSCGLVSVNVANEDLSCPICSSNTVIQYGDGKVSTPTKFNQSLQWGNFHCGVKEHKCPSCHEFKMKFDWTGVMSD
jgi:RNA polymerase subunit RPABC4/transcription elongation factor Spt4